ncbi:MAG: hypothetical protein ACM3UU_03925 [Ignavibacteriales bacterium]
MKKIITFVVLASFLILSGCANTQSNSGIDIKKMEDNFKKYDNRSKYNKAARKSIFPKMKDK